MNRKERAKEIGRRLKTLRGLIPQTKLARELQIPYSSYRSYESGERVPGDLLKERIASYFGKSVGEIFFPEDITK